VIFQNNIAWPPPVSEAVQHESTGLQHGRGRVIHFQAIYSRKLKVE
jgi:hypothetical protein